MDIILSIYLAKGHDTPLSAKSFKNVLNVKLSEALL